VWRTTTANAKGNRKEEEACQCLGLTPFFGTMQAVLKYSGNDRWCTDVLSTEQGKLINFLFGMPQHAQCGTCAMRLPFNLESMPRLPSTESPCWTHTSQLSHPASAYDVFSMVKPPLHTDPNGIPGARAGGSMMKTGAGASQTSRRTEGSEAVGRHRVRRGRSSASLRQREGRSPQFRTRVPGAHVQTWYDSHGTAGKPPARCMLRLVGWTRESEMSWGRSSAA
jgi:hypothetical protein